MSTPRQSNPWTQRLSSVAIVLIAAQVLGAQTTWTGVASSSFGDPANWTAGVPTASVTATIPAGTPNSPSTAGVAGAACLGLNVNAGATMTVASGHPLITNGTLNLLGTLTYQTPMDANGNVEVLPGGVLTLPNGVHTFAASLVISPGGTLSMPSTSTVRFDGVNGTLAGVYANLARLEIAVTASFSNPSAVTTGPVTLFSGTWGASTTVEGSALLLGGTLGGSLDVNGDVTFAGTSCTSFSHIKCAGNWTANSSFAPSSGLVTFDGSGLQTISGAGLFRTLAVSSGATVNSLAPLSFTSLNLNGSLTHPMPIDANGPVNVLPGGALILPSGVHTFADNLIISPGGTLSMPSTSTVRFDGVNGQLGGVYSNPATLEIAVTGSFTNPSAVTTGPVTQFSGAWQAATTVEGSAVLLGGTLTGSLDVNGDVTFAGTACTSFNHIKCAGNWTANSAFAPSSGLVSFDGSGAQTISGAGLFPQIVVKSGASVVPAADLALRAISITVEAGGGLSAADKRLAIHRPSASTAVYVEGILGVGPGGELALGPGTSVLIAGAAGSLSVIGTCSEPAVVAGEAGGGYAFTVAGPAGIAASNFVFKQMGPNGIFLDDVHIAAPPNDIRGGTFDSPSAAPNAVLFKIQRSFATDLRYVTFLNTPGHPSAKSVRDLAPSSSGPISFTNFSGGFSGPAFEDDPNNLIAWNPPDPSQPLGLCDVNPPQVAITTPAGGAVFGTTSVAVAASIIDENAITVTSTPAGISASLPAGLGLVSGALALLTEGANTLTVTGTDQFGNVGGMSVTVIRDMTVPQVTINSPTEDAVFGSASGIVTATVVDATATQVTIGGATIAVLAGGGQASGSVMLTEGPNAISVTATDAGGNATTVVRNVIFDATAPAVAITSPLNATAFGPGASPITVTAFVNDATPTTVTSSPIGLSGSAPAGGGTVAGAVALVEGTNTIEVTATDAAGRIGQASVMVILDTTAPIVALTSPADGSVVRGTVDFHATANDVSPGTEVSRVDLFVDGNLVASLTAAPYETSFDTTALPDGSHTFSATAIDGKNNSAATSATVVVDNTAPTITISQPADGAIVGGDLAFVAMASDPGTGLTRVVMRGNGAVPTIDGSVNYASLVASDTRTSQVATTAFPDGLLVLVASTVDAAGNSASASVTVHIDNSAPASSLIRPANGSLVSGTLIIEAAANDPNLVALGIFVDEVLLAQASSPTLVTTLDTTAILDGSITITAVSIDSVGNSSIASAIVTVDNIPTIKISPQTLNLKSKGGENSVTADLQGSTVALLIPTESHAIELRVPGGSPVPSTHGFSGDDAPTGGGTQLTIKFDRQALINSIKAGVAANMIQPNSQVTVTLVSSGQVIGSDLIRIIGP